MAALPKLPPGAFKPPPPRPIELDRPYVRKPSSRVDPRQGGQPRKVPHYVDELQRDVSPWKILPNVLRRFLPPALTFGLAPSPLADATPLGVYGDGPVPAPGVDPKYGSPGPELLGVSPALEFVDLKANGSAFVASVLDAPTLPSPVFLDPDLIAQVETWFDPEIFVAPEALAVARAQGAVRPLPRPEPQQRFTVHIEAQGPEVVVRVRKGTDAAIPRFDRKRRDKKVRARSYAFGLWLINKTWGTVDEAWDFIQALAWNTYSLENGRITFAMSVVDGNYAELVRGVAVGDFQVDWFGAVRDIALMQVQDALIGKLSSEAQKRLNEAGYSAIQGVQSGSFLRRPITEGSNEDGISSSVQQRLSSPGAWLHAQDAKLQAFLQSSASGIPWLFSA